MASNRNSEPTGRTGNQNISRRHASRIEVYETAVTWILFIIESQVCLVLQLGFPIKGHYSNMVVLTSRSGNVACSDLCAQGPGRCIWILLLPFGLLVWPVKLRVKYQAPYIGFFDETDGSQQTGHKPHGLTSSPVHQGR
jgi:hypothetical protein